ncbi:2-oxo-4-hydroxy-4-carboxy-5-ureidoimidazoline (OHCU) decarboxylase [hydrothermal vent metagenome]|uniref:2-oxo-4-hydroxy-4-carboxy-5-ureidoimidazoline decarboxylase n=1 Tax=hydrothermal vent metagenome TaxID=652676 RepID=A0A3B0W5W3_9ZZZZ
MSMNLEQLNQLATDDLMKLLETCCGASVWCTAMAHFQPYASIEMLHIISDAIWRELDEDDYLEAFTHHPMIGDLDALKDKFQDKFQETAAWASDEQQGSNCASEQTLLELQTANQDYLAEFGFIFIVCATGKSASQMLQLLQARINNGYAEEIQLAADEQNKITHLRLNKLLNDSTD